MKTPPSLGVRDVARMAGVSPMSVSRALNHPEQVSADTLAKVRRALEQTGFIGNRLASGLASRKSRLVAVMVPAIAAPVFQNIIQAISAELSAADYHVLLGQAGYDAQEHGSPLDAVIRQRPDGLVLVGVTPSALDRRKLMAAGIPTVETWDVVADPVEATIGFSHEALAVAVVAYLVDRGCRHLAFVGGAHARARRRADAFLGAVQALREAGHDLTAARCVVEAPSGVERGRAALTELLRRQPRLDGVFCSSDLLAFGVAKEGLLQGRTVPGDLKIVGLGDLPFSADVVPSLTSVRIHDEDIGRRAAQFIVRRAQSGLHERLRIDVGFSIVGRDST